MHARMRRTISIVVVAVLVAVIAATVVVGRRRDHRTVVRGAVDEEVAAYFQDPAVKATFAKHGYTLALDVVNSRAVAGRAAHDDFAVAAGSFASPLGGTTVFSSPLVVAATEPAAAMLGAAGVARHQSGVGTLDLNKFVRFVDAGHMLNGKLPAIATTNIATSNAADAFLAAAATAANNGKAPSDVSATLLNQLSPLVRADHAAASMAALWKTVTTPGAANAPLAWIYEAQFAAAAAAHGSGDPQPVLLYPTPGTVSNVTVSSRTPAGAAVRSLLANDPTLQQLAARNGYRTAAFAPPPAAGVRVIPTPSAAPPPPAATLDFLRSQLQLALQHPDQAGKR